MKDIFYDAFISYRHMELDSYIAKKLHGMLEHYKIPKKIQKQSGKKKITRIFRDQEELPLSADLSSNIKTALEHSEFLIVICSPEAMESRWVKTEIETFLKTHSKDRVLTILVRGEPEEAFPEILCYRERVIIEDGVEKTIRVPIEPLAADVRAASKEEAGKKLKKEVLRILAPMLSCRFDDLRQRQKEYRTKWIIRILAAIMCVAVAFGIYAARQASAIAEQYQTARKNQARYLCNVSDQLLKSGDREGALQTALALQTEEGKEALVPEQMYALNNALYSYQNKYSICLDADRELVLEHPVMRNFTSEQRRNGYIADFSPEGSYFFVLDSVGKARFFDSSTGENFYSCVASDFPELSETKFQEGKPISESEILLMTEREIVRLDLDRKQLVSVYDVAEGSYISLNNFKVSDSVIACFAYSEFSAYDLAEKRFLLKRESYSMDEEVITFEGEPKGFALSPSGTQLAVVFAPDYLEDDPCRIEVYSLETGESRSWDIETFDKSCSLVFADEEHLGILWTKVIENEYAFEAYRPYGYGVYHIPSETLLWEKEAYGVIADYSQGFLQVEMLERAGEEDGMLEPMLLCGMGTQISVTNVFTGEELACAQTYQTIVNIQKLGNTRFLVGTGDGSIFIFTTTSKGYLSETSACGTEIEEFYYAPQQQTAAVLMDGGSIVRFYRTAKDPYMKELKMDSSSIEYICAEDKNYRIVLEKENEEHPQEQMHFWNVDTDEKLGTIASPEAHQTIELWEVFHENGEDFALYSLRSKDYLIKEPQVLILQNLQTGETLYQKELENIPEHSEKASEGSYDTEFQVVTARKAAPSVVYMESYNCFEIVNYKTGECLKSYEQILPLEEGFRYRFGKVEVSEDEKYFIFSGFIKSSGTDYITSSDDSCYVFFKLWDIEQGKWYDYQGNDVFYLKVAGNYGDEFNTDNVILALKTMQAAVYLEENEVLIVNLWNGEITQKIPFTGKNSCELKFFDEEKYLLLYGDEGHLIMWSLDEQKVVMKDSEQNGNIREIYVDDSNQYFGVQSISSTASTIGAYDFNIYYVDKGHRFYHFANVQNGFASFQCQEIFNFGANSVSYYTEFYAYETLKARAEEILQGKEMTEEELHMYYISNN